MFTRTETAIPDVFLVEPQAFGDHRGYFMETYSRDKFLEIGVSAEFVQDNQSYSAVRGTLRGIHFQNAPFAQAKLVRVLRGAVWDVAVDLRRGSPTYKKWIGAELSEENRRMLFIPRGFGHGFKTLTENVLFCYKVDNPYDRDSDRGIRFDDPELAIDWGAVDKTLLSKKDVSAPLLGDSDCNFVYGEI